MRRLSRGRRLGLVLLCYLLPLLVLGVALLLDVPIRNALIAALVLLCLSVHLSVVLWAYRGNSLQDTVEMARTLVKQKWAHPATEEEGGAE